MMDSTKSIAALLDEGLRLHQAEKFEAAAALYHQALEACPEHPDALHYLGLLTAQQGQIGAAVELLQRALRGNPRSSVCQRDLGILFLGFERFEEAEAAFRKAIDLQPNFPEAFCSLGRLYHDLCSLEEAIGCYERAVAQKPDFVEATEGLQSARASKENLFAFAQAFRTAHSGGTERKLGDSPGAKLEKRELLPRLLNLIGLRGVGAEIGVKEGKFSEQILRHWQGMLLYSVDPWREFGASEYADVSNVSQAQQDELYQQTIRRLMPFQRRSVIWRLTSKEAADLVPDDSLDFCYIDADHSYRGVSDDIQLWHPKVKKGGLLGGHDFVSDGDYWFGKFGVHRAVTEFVAASKQDIFISGEPAGGFPSWFVVKK